MLCVGIAALCVLYIFNDGNGMGARYDWLLFAAVIE